MNNKKKQGNYSALKRKKATFPIIVWPSGQRTPMSVHQLKSLTGIFPTTSDNAFRFPVSSWNLTPRRPLCSRRRYDQRLPRMTRSSFFESAFDLLNMLLRRRSPLITRQTHHGQRFLSPNNTYRSYL